MATRRDFLIGSAATAALLTLPGVAFAGTHYAFVRFEANGTVVTGNTDITNIGGEELPRAEWIQCKRVSYGLKRDIGTGARVSGHTHYDRVEFDTVAGPTTARLLEHQKERTSLDVVVKLPRDGKPLVVRGKAHIESVVSKDKAARVTFFFENEVENADAVVQWVSKHM
jgi:hypothetical protein